MKLRIYKGRVVESLRSDIAEHLELYRSGDFAYLDQDSSCYMELGIEADEEVLKNLNSLAIPEGRPSSAEEVAPSLMVFGALTNVTPYLARDERLWTYLTHSVLLAYSRKRWPIPDDNEEAIKHIRTHFFARSARQIERDNAVSRLWWMAYICSRSQSLPIERALDVFLLQSDVRASIIERPTTAQSLRIFESLLRHLDRSYEKDQKWFERRILRGVMEELNRLGGVKLMEVMPDEELDAIISEAFKTCEKQVA